VPECVEVVQPLFGKSAGLFEITSDSPAGDNVFGVDPALVLVVGPVKGEVTQIQPVVLMGPLHGKQQLLPLNFQKGLARGCIFQGFQSLPVEYSLVFELGGEENRNHDKNDQYGKRDLGQYRQYPVHACRFILPVGFEQFLDGLVCRPGYRGFMHSQRALSFKRERKTTLFFNLIPTAYHI
jgi:hypothetical protein